MKKIILLAIISFTANLAMGDVTEPAPTPVVVQQAQQEQPQVKEAPKTIPEKIYEYANKYNVSGELMEKIVRCENHELNPKLQSKLKYKFSDPSSGIIYGEREMSYGLAQIHLPAHPGISYEQATDVDFSLDFMAKNIAKGKGSMWSCYNKVK